VRSGASNGSTAAALANRKPHAVEEQIIGAAGVFVAAHQSNFNELGLDDAIACEFGGDGKALRSNTIPRLDPEFIRLVSRRRGTVLFCPFHAVTPIWHGLRSGLLQQGEINLDLGSR
jgi:hypothetical protein